MLEFNFDLFPELITERLVLRQMTPDDAQALFFLNTHDEVLKYLDFLRMKTIDDAVKKIERITNDIKATDCVYWAISTKEDPTLIGTICLFHFKKQHHRGEIGYMLHPGFWRKGILQECMQTVIDYGFDVLNLHSMEAIVDPENTASIALLEKNKFVREAYFKEDFFQNGKFLDTAIYSLLKSNWK
jgi:ribosomal-protein-alanine N-acetyltransferase